MAQEKHNQPPQGLQRRPEGDPGASVGRHGGDSGASRSTTQSSSSATNATRRPRLVGHRTYGPAGASAAPRRIPVITAAGPPPPFEGAPGFATLLSVRRNEKREVQEYCRVSRWIIT